VNGLVGDKSSKARSPVSRWGGTGEDRDKFEKARVHYVKGLAGGGSDVGEE